MTISRSQAVLAIDKIIRVLLYALIFWLPYSSAMVESLVGTALVLWIIKRSLKVNHSTAFKAFALPQSYLNSAICVFLLACLASVAGSPFLSISIRGFLTKTLEWFIVYFLVLEVFTERKHVLMALSVFVISSSATILDSLYQFYISFKDLFLGHTIEPFSRATAGFKTSNGLGGYLTCVVPLFLALIFFYEKKNLKFIFGILFILSLWSLYVTQSRGAWMGVVFGVGVFLSQLKNKTAGLLMLGIVLAGFAALQSGMHFIEKPGSLDRQHNVDWRRGIWRDTSTMIFDRPWIGHGLNTYMKVFQAYRQNPDEHATYAHNSFLQIAAETGLAGLLSFAFIIAKILDQGLRHSWQYRRAKDPVCFVAFGITSGISAFLLHAFVDNNFYSLQLSVYFWFMAGLLMTLSMSTKNNYSV